MKKNYNWIVFILLLITFNYSYSQSDNKPWIFGLEFNAIDFYPVGEDLPQGPYFDEFFNLTDHWNIGLPKFTAYKYFSERLSLSGSVSFNQIKKLKELGTPTGERPDNLRYLGLDGMFNYYFTSTKLKPFIAIGGGYTWVEEGHFDSSKIQGNKLIGAGTLNGAVGAKYWFDDSFGLNLQTTYKHSFQDYLSKHWQHSLGVIFHLKVKEDEVEEEEKDRDGDGVLDEFDVCPDIPGLETLAGCPDTDNDGIADKDDLCPEIPGLEKYSGCPDTDGDGYADNVDDCPDEKGTLQGCPEEEEVVYCFEDLEDIPAYFASLKRDGKIEVQGLRFKVQVGAYRKSPTLKYFDFLKDVGEVEQVMEDELVKFRLGDYKTLNETEVIRLSVFDQGIRDVFVIAFFDGVRITMREAIEILCGKE